VHFLDDSVVAASKEFLAKSLVNDNYGGITIEF
jgi:hypothetical protein